MAFQVGDIVEVKIECEGPLDGALNVRHYRVDSNVGPGADPSAAAIGFFTAFSGVYRPLMSTQTTFRQVSCQQILPLPRKRIGYANQTPLAGTGGVELLPKQVCGLLYLITPLSGNAETGRVFVPYPGETENGPNGAPTNAYDVDLAALGLVMSTSINVGAGGANSNLTPVVFHRASLTATAISGYQIGSRWGTQRRRQNNKFQFI